jgi:ASCH domain
VRPQPPLALSIRQPWAWAICAGLKDVENRTWSTAYRGLFIVHAGARKPAASDIEWIGEHVGISVPTQLPLGALIGQAELRDVVEGSESPWAFPGHFHWLLANATLWDEPISHRGQLRFFKPSVASAAIQDRSFSPEELGTKPRSSGGSIERITVQLTQGNINNNHVYLRMHLEFSPRTQLGLPLRVMGKAACSPCTSKG